MTYAEIIKHLEVYSDGISGMHEDFDPGLQETCVNAIDFINRQKADNSNLQEENSNLISDLISLQKDLSSAMAEIDSWQSGYMTQKEEIANLETELKAMRGAANSYKAEIERLKSIADSFTDIGKLYSEIKAEAYKDFAEEVNKELFGEEYQLDKARRRAVERVLNRLTNRE